MQAVTNYLPSIRLNTTVLNNGRIELNVPLPLGSKVTVIVVQDEDLAHADLLSAAESSLDFWDNALDDEDWNDA